MAKHPLRQIGSIGKRILGAVIGVVLGLIAGVIVVLAVVGFGEHAPWTIIGCGIAGLVCGAVIPAPFLFIGEVVLGILGVNT